MEVETISAGSGVDKITLNEGADVVVFDTIKAAANANNIIGFSAAGGDKLDLTGYFTASAFTNADISSTITDNTVYYGASVTEAAVTAYKATTQTSGALKAIAITNVGNIYYLNDAGTSSGNPTAELIGSIGADAGTLMFGTNFSIAA